MTKYALLIGDVIDTISLDPPRQWIEPVFGEADENGEVLIVEAGRWGDILPGWVAVPDDAFGGFVANSDGTFSAPPVPPEAIPGNVSARQFRMQLRKPILPTFPNGIRDQVIAYVASLPGEEQDAFEYSGTFVRDDPTMQAGFEAMGFTSEQIDAFFLAASKL